jgi:cytochrome c-type biogenesis protein CcmH
MKIVTTAIRGSAPVSGLVFLLLALLMVPVLPATLFAQAEQVTRGEDTAERAIGQIRSPYCPGLMLEVCPSPEAGALRDSIRDLAREGMAEAEIVEWMVGRHGEEWRAVPKRTGRGMFAWLFPPLFLIAGAGLVFAHLRRGRTRSEDAAPGDRPQQDELSDTERARLDAALSEWEMEEEAEV